MHSWRTDDRGCTQQWHFPQRPGQGRRTRPGPVAPPHRPGRRSCRCGSPGHGQLHTHLRGLRSTAVSAMMATMLARCCSHPGRPELGRCRRSPRAAAGTARLPSVATTSCWAQASCSCTKLRCTLTGGPCAAAHHVEAEPQSRSPCTAAIAAVTRLPARQGQAGGLFPAGAAASMPCRRAWPAFLDWHGCHRGEDVACVPPSNVAADGNLGRRDARCSNLSCGLRCAIRLFRHVKQPTPRV